MAKWVKQLRLLLVAMPLLAGVYEAYDAASRDLEHEPVIAWSITFVEKLATRLPLTLILAFVVYGLVSVVGRFFGGYMARPSRLKLRDTRSRHHLGQISLARRRPHNSLKGAAFSIIAIKPAW